MPAPDGPRPPGTRPAAFEFPFAAAQTVKAEIETLIERLGSTLDTHRQAVTEARVDFEGETRQDFDADFESRTAELDAGVSALRAQLDQLEAAMATAKVRQQQSRDAMEAWNRDKAAYDDYTRSAATAQTGLR